MMWRENLAGVDESSSSTQSLHRSKSKAACTPKDIFQSRMSPAGTCPTKDETTSNNLEPKSKYHV